MRGRLDLRASNASWGISAHADGRLTVNPTEQEGNPTIELARGAPGHSLAVDQDGNLVCGRDIKPSGQVTWDDGGFVKGEGGLRLGVGQNEAMRISPAGNAHFESVGIQVPSGEPDYALDVRGESLLTGVNLRGPGQSAGTFSPVVATYLTTDGHHEGSYVHIRTPFNTGIDGMFFFHVVGYAYYVPAVVDITYTGYSYPTVDGIIKTAINDLSSTAMEAAMYVGPTDRDIYLRFRPSTLYFLSIRVDSMYVGSGRIVHPGELSITKHANETLYFWP